MDIRIYTTEPSKDYELIDSGNGEKFERFGNINLVRPDPQALWTPALAKEIWAKADGRFVRSGTSGSWKMGPAVPAQWQVSIEGLTFSIKPSSFKHVGIFPEHAPHWKWIGETIVKAQRPVSVLNLFGYTGGATLAAALAGGEVCHVDASKVAVTAAKQNAEITGLGEKSIRWIVDDVAAFIKREIKRGKKYDAIIMDPPSFGRGPKGEVWKIEDNFMELLSLCKQLLSEKPLFLIVNGYAAGYSALGYAHCLETVFGTEKGLDCGELSIADKAGNVLPSGIFGRIQF